MGQLFVHTMQDGAESSIDAETLKRLRDLRRSTQEQTDIG